jgi:hypothetical protein
MSYQATVYNVMIASPSDVQPERNIVRNVVHEWNAVNASTQKTVLLPVSWETHSTPSMGDRPQAIINKQILKDSDLLIAAFWTRLGTPTGAAASGTVEEIEEHVKANKPAMIYFSSAPVVPESLDRVQYEALKSFKAEYLKRGLCETYESTTEFQDKVRRQLGIKLNTHAYFEDIRQTRSGDMGLATPPSGPAMPTLSREAQELLLEAVAGSGDIIVAADSEGSTVGANSKNFVEPNNPRSRAVWEGAVQELVDQDLLQHYEGVMFRVTRRGFEVADLLRR